MNAMQDNSGEHKPTEEELSARATEKAAGQQTTPPPGDNPEGTQPTVDPGPVLRDDQDGELQAFDDLDGDEVDQLVGDELSSEAGVNPEGFSAKPRDFPMPKENDTNA